MNKRQAKKNLLRKLSNRDKVRFWIKVANNYSDKLIKAEDARNKAIDKNVELAIAVGRLKRKVALLQIEITSLKGRPWWKKVLNGSK